MWDFWKISIFKTKSLKSRWPEFACLYSKQTGLLNRICNFANYVGVGGGWSMSHVDNASNGFFPIFDRINVVGAK